MRGHRDATVELDVGRIHYEEVGPADGPAVVCVSGFLMGASLWRELGTRLAERGVRCIAADWPLGAQREPLAPGTDLSPQGVARIVAAFLDALDLRDVVLVGNDSGGAISQLVAVEHPERLGALVLTNCDTFEHFPPKAFKPLLTAARTRATFRAALAPMKTATARRSPLGYGLLSHGDVDHLAREWVQPIFRDDRIMEELRRFTSGIDPSLTIDAARRLAGFDRPIVLVWGADDRLFPPSQAERFVREVAGARLEPVTGSRTFVMLDQPDRLAGVVAELATQRSPAPAR